VCGGVVRRAPAYASRRGALFKPADTAQEIADDFTVLPEGSQFVAERDLLRHELVHSCGLLVQPYCLN
jgi:hypothetical protein